MMVLKNPALLRAGSHRPAKDGNGQLACRLAAANS